MGTRLHCLIEEIPLLVEDPLVLSLTVYVYASVVRQMNSSPSIQSEGDSIHECFRPSRLVWEARTCNISSSSSRDGSGGQRHPSSHAPFAKLSTAGSQQCMNMLLFNVLPGTKYDISHPIRRLTQMPGG